MLRKILAHHDYRLFLLLIFSLTFPFYGTSYAATGETLGDMARNIGDTLGDVAALLQGISLIAGIGFAISAVFKFKQHKDNPTQIPVGAPIALVFIGAALIFLPSLISTTGRSLFDDPRQALTGQQEFNLIE